MAEVIGLIAAGGQFVEQSVKLIKLARSTREKYRDTPKEIENWQQQLESLQKIVDSIRQTPSLHNADEVKSTVDRCNTISNFLLQTFDTIHFTESDSFRHKTWRAAVSILKEEEIRSSFSELEQLKTSLSLHIAIKNLNVNQRITHTTTLLNDLLSSVKSGSGSGTDEESCLQALFITDTRSDRDGFITTKGQRTPGTFEWIPQTRQYQEWSARNGPGLIWISGPPGKGKTVISIFLSELLEATKPNSTVIFFFCDNKLPSRNHAVSILRGLMLQLIQQHQKVLPYLMSTWKIQQGILFQTTSFETLWRIFAQMLEALRDEEVCCVLDAPDECDEESLTSLLCKISNSYNSPGGLPLKLIIASREEPKVLPEALEGHPRITLEDVDDDLKLYISETVSHLAGAKMIEGSPLHRRIEKAFYQGAEGTFLWVSYMAQDLKHKSLSEIELALTKLPQGLYEVYERIMSQIRVESRDKIADMLMWLLFAEHPLEIDNLCDAIEVEASPTLTRKQVCIDYVRSCGHLLQLQVFKMDSYTWITYDAATYTGSRLRATFLHQSAKDFLLRTDGEGLSLPITACSNRAHVRILDRLFAILEHQFGDGAVLDDPMIDSGLEFPLLEYAILYLGYHMNQLGEEIGLILPKHEVFFGEVSNVRGTWFSYIQDLDTCPYYFPSPSGSTVPLLHVACQQGLYRLVRTCLESKAMLAVLGRHWKINQKWGNDEETPLHFAVKNGSSDVIKLLLDHGASVRSKDFHQETPLHYAIRHSTAEVYKQLASAKRSSKVYREEAKQYSKKKNTLPPRHKSLLHLAAESGWESLCQQLIQHHNYNTDWETDSGTKAIHLALKRERLSLAKRFVTEWGASLTPEIQLLRAILTPHGGPVLKRVFFEGPLRTYTDHWGCNINAVDTERCTILYYDDLSYHTMEEIMNLGLPINFNHLNNRHQTPLHCENSWTDDPRLLKMFLLNSQFDLNKLDCEGCTPLHYSSRRIISTRLGNSTSHNGSDRSSSLEAKEIQKVKLLLDYGADRHLLNNEGRSAVDIVRKGRDMVPDRILKALTNYSTCAIDVRQIGLVLEDVTSPWVTQNGWIIPPLSALETGSFTVVGL
ncbi:uncharacterized protein B0J16DRAFT_298485 [Fusarium flagelliforme]|uniref:uncharacterized protein n=1 Tax=Fusarium flagelliforme TaxID=2675880 RepID=UPI001E8DB8C9|nr:uncharacterized protein B0J16DRAFT_298485 [Fusarium flagelliforme]KAH7198798.1 hypothetical protein B0J16DRAFT_298485 [Fusarium flagelliforme]